MLIRALIVVLAILNAGVALWWWRQPAPVDLPVPAMSPPEGVPVLQLWSEVEALAPPAVAPAEPDAMSGSDSQAAAVAVAGQAPVTPPPVATPAAPVCISLGVFADRAQLDAALAQAGAALAQARPRQLPVSGGTFRVMLPPAASRQAAQAAVARIVAAGFSDYFIISQGELANAVALGQFRNRDGAQRRLDELKAAGFAATLVPSQTGDPGWWLDARLAADTTAQQARRVTGAGRVQSLECARLR